MTRSDTTRRIVLLALACLTFLPLLGRHDIVTSHEARVVQTARQMAESGWPWNARLVEVPRTELVKTDQGERLVPRSDGATIHVNPWVVPVMNGEIRLQKPPLPYWCAAVLYRLIGVSEFASRIVPALMGAISVLLVWDVARMLLGRVGAWYAGMVWVSSYFIIDEFRKAMADPYLAFFTLGATWTWLRAQRSSCDTGVSPVREAPDAAGPQALSAQRTAETPVSRSLRFSHPIVATILFHLMLAVGILAKGPIILLFIAVIASVYHIAYQRRIRASVAGHVIGFVLLILLCLPWAIAILRSVPNAMELWRYESIGALSDKSENARDWWYYLPNVFQITLPWTPIWIMGWIFPLRFPKRRRFFGMACTALLLIVFSCSYAKKNSYLLPLMFIQTMITAEGLRWLTLIPKRRPIEVAIRRVTIAGVAFSIFAQLFVSGFLAWKDNRRSPRDAARYASKLVQESDGRVSLLSSSLPDELTVYLPLNLRMPNDARDFLMIVDDRKGEADKIAHTATTLPSGPVESIVEMPIPNSAVKRWKLYRLSGSPVQRPPPGPG